MLQIFCTCFCQLSGGKNFNVEVTKETKFWIFPTTFKKSFKNEFVLLLSEKFILIFKPSFRKIFTKKKKTKDFLFPGQKEKKNFSPLLTRGRAVTPSESLYGLFGAFICIEWRFRTVKLHHRHPAELFQIFPFPQNKNKNENFQIENREVK